MPLYRFICNASLLGCWLALANATAQPLTLKSQPIDKVPAHVVQQLATASDSQTLRQIVIKEGLFLHDNWQQILSRVELQLRETDIVTVLPKQLSLKDESLLWHGYIAGSPNSQVALVITAQGVSGSVSHKGQLWQIRRMADGRNIMFQTAKELLDADDSIKLTPAQAKQQAAIARQQSNQVLLPTVAENANGFTNETRLQVMVYYDIQELETYPDLLELIDLEFLQANAALLNSGVDAQLNAVVKLPISRHNASRGMLDLMLSGEEMFSHLARDRERYEADLVHYFGLNLDDWACGLAYLSAFPTGEAYADWGLGATHSNCMGSLVFAHEIGHNFGAKHDRHVEPDADSHYNYGYVDLETASRTIMAYTDLCDENGIDCERLPYFSNPALEHQSRPLGIAATEPEAADNHQMLNFAALTLANFSGAGVPTGLTATNTNTGPVNINWQPFPGATSYELYRSSSCAYDSFKTLVVSTTETSFADVDAAGGRNCYFVQAINENLLSGAQRSVFSLPESGFGSGPALDKIADQRVESIDQTIAVTFASAALVAPTVDIVQHDLPYNPQHALQDLGNGRYQLSVSNLSHNDGTAIVKVTTDGVFEVFNVTFRGNANTPPVIVAPQKVSFNQQSSTSFNVDILDNQINLVNPIGLSVQSEDSHLLPNSALDYVVNYTENGAQLIIDIDPQHKLFGTTALSIQVTDGEHLVSQRVEVEIVRVLNQLPVVPTSTTMYLDSNKPLQRLLPVYDADNDVLEFTLLAAPTKGQVTISNNAFTYQSDTNFNNEDSFSYRVTELYSGNSFDATVIITTKAQQYLLPKQKLVSSINSAHFLLDYHGQLWAWGGNSWQVFGTDHAQTQPTPVKLYNSVWADISISDNNIMLIHQDGSLWQLGSNSLTGANEANTPKRIGNANDWLAVLDAGNGNVYCQLLLKADRSLWAIGTCYELAAAGILDDSQSALQQPVQIDALYHWVSGSHSQTETVLIDINGKIWSGATDPYVQYAGRGSEIAYLAPVNGINSKALSVRAVTFGTYAQTELGLMAWGSLPVNAPWQWQDHVLRPTAVALDSPVIKHLSAASNYLLMLDTENALWTAGGYINSDNPNGALGRGEFADKGLAKVDFANGWQQVFAAHDNSFGLSNSGQLLVAGTYDLESGIRTFEPADQISSFTAIAQFSLNDLGYTDTDADGIADYLETDADNDGLPDGWELLYGLDKQNPSDVGLDNDNDGLTNLQEYQLGTNPNQADTDADGMPDDWELQYGLNPNSANDASSDNDNDGLTNMQEYQLGTKPNETDTDGDSMPDGWEVQYGLNPNSATDTSSDNDNDGLTNLQEYQLGTKPNEADTDGDSMPDGWEVQYDLNPLNPADAGSDLDNDDFTALQEYQNGTHPNVSNKVASPPPPATSSSGGSVPYWMLLLLSLAYGKRRKKII